MLEEKNGSFTLDPRTYNYVTDTKELDTLNKCLDVFMYDVFENQFDVESFSYNFQCALILNDPYTPIKCISNQTEEMHILSISQAPVMFFYTRNHSEKIVNLFLDKYEASKTDFAHYFVLNFFNRTNFGHERFISIKSRKMLLDIPSLEIESKMFDRNSIFSYDRQFREELQNFFPDDFIIEYDDAIMNRLEQLFPKMKTYGFVAPFEPLELTLLRHLKNTYKYMKNPSHSAKLRDALVYGAMSGTI